MEQEIKVVRGKEDAGDRVVTVELTGYELAALINCYSRGIATMTGNIVAAVELSVHMAKALEQLGPEPAIALMERLGDIASANFPAGVRVSVPADHLATDTPLTPHTPQATGGLVS